MREGFFEEVAPELRPERGGAKREREERAFWAEGSACAKAQWKEGVREPMRGGRALQRWEHGNQGGNG